MRSSAPTVLPPGTIQISAGIGLAKDIATLGDNADAWTGWVNATVKAIQAGNRRFWAQRPVAKLIRLERKMWAARSSAESTSPALPQLDAIKHKSMMSTESSELPPPSR